MVFFYFLFTTNDLSEIRKTVLAINYKLLINCSDVSHFWEPKKVGMCSKEISLNSKSPAPLNLCFKWLEVGRGRIL